MYKSNYYRNIYTFLLPVHGYVRGFPSKVRRDLFPASVGKESSIARICTLDRSTLSDILNVGDQFNWFLIAKLVLKIANIYLSSPHSFFYLHLCE